MGEHGHGHFHQRTMTRDEYSEPPSDRNTLTMLPVCVCDQAMIAFQFSSCVRVAASMAFRVGYPTLPWPERPRVCLGVGHLSHLGLNAALALGCWHCKVAWSTQPQGTTPIDGSDG
ncbi:unnamed protein product, partial [Aphanomyces euteiches]